MKLQVDYCWKDNNAPKGYLKGSITYPRNPRKTVESEIARVMKAAEEKEKKPLIVVGFIEYGS